MRIKHRMNNKNICLITIDGNIALEGVADLKNYVKPFLENQKVDTIVINFDKVDFIDSSGIGLVVSMYKTLQQRQARLLLTHLSKKNTEIFHMTRLDKILSIYPTEEEALASV